MLAAWRWSRRRPSSVSAVARIESLYKHFRGIISVQLPKPMGSIALIALVWWCAGVRVPTNTARADDCLIAPNSPAPAGSHWYFRTDRAKQRNCWYLHAPDQPAQPVAAQAISDASPPTHITYNKCVQKACDRISKRLNVNKPWRQRCSALAARQAARCAYEQRDNGPTCPAKRTERKLGDINSRRTRSSSKPVVADRQSGG